MAADRVTLIIEGLMLEKLLNRAAADGAPLVKVARIGLRQIQTDTNARGARIITELCQKYRISCRTVSLGGISAVAAGAKRRITAAAAFTVAFAITSLFLTRIWHVDIKLLRGDDIPPGAESVLTETGIIKGNTVWNADTSLAEVKLNSLEGCAHASVSRRGVAVLIEIACEEASPEVYTLSGEGDLIAARDGIVASVNVISGTAAVSPGDTVRKGQVLIAGYERTSNDSVHDVVANGSVRARCWTEAEAQCRTFETKKQYTGKESLSVTLVTPWKNFPLKTAANFDMCDSETSVQPLVGMFAPVYIERTYLREYRLVNVNSDTDALKAMLLAESEEKALQKVPDFAEIIDKWTDFSMIESEDIIHARTVIETETEIAVTRGYMEENQLD